jgi:hypothetical protein
MSDNQRRLLPYEHQLVEALGITKEDYLDFVAQQHVYRDVKEGTVLDVRNWEVVAIVLTVIGVLFQVAAVLFAPKPQTPTIAGQGSQSRDDIFAPRFGFNSAQQLAAYGEPIPLVYTNTATNPAGGVRVASNLVWSAVQSYGSSQFVQLMFVIGAGGMRTVDLAKSAFGQVPLRDLVAQSYWAYFNPNATGSLQNNHLLPPLAGPQISDPSFAGSTQDNPYRIRDGINGDKLDGFSHAYSPSASATFGIYGVVPINVEYSVRDPEGNLRWDFNRIFSRPAWNPITRDVKVGDQRVVWLEQWSGPREGHFPEATDQVNNLRQTLANVFDAGSLFKLGSAEYRILSINKNDIFNDSMVVVLECTKAGALPLVDYNSTAEQDLNPADFFVKALVRIEKASYETVSACRIVDFSIKAKVFKRISGRQQSYGSNQQQGYASSDNGLKRRSAMFIVHFKRTTEANYRTITGIFVVARAADIENFVYFRFDSQSEASNWQFVFEPVADAPTEFDTRPELLDEYNNRVCYFLENSGAVVRFPAQRNSLGGSLEAFEYRGTVYVSTNKGWPAPDRGNNPLGTTEWAIFANQSDTQLQHSFDNGPEFSLAAITEQIVEPFSSFSSLYQGLSLFGFNMYSGKTIQDLRSFTLFVDQGRECRTLSTTSPGSISPFPNECPCNAPDIFLDTILDTTDGIGQFASLHSVDVEQLAFSKRFCQANQLFMDGVIAEPTAWREFWAVNAGFSLLELAKIGGKDTLIPAVPYDKNNGQINGTIIVSALFNQGNILEDSYKEEFIDYGNGTQDVVLTGIYRTSESGSAFAKNSSVEVQLADTVEGVALRETVDMSRFVTTKEQAVKVLKYLCNVRRHSRRAIEFKTFPTDSPVFPGAYIYVELAQNQWQNIYSGIIEDDGLLNLPLVDSLPDDDYSMIIYWPNSSSTFPGNLEIADGFLTVRVRNGRAVRLENGTEWSIAQWKGYLFVLGKSVRNKRIFRVTEVSMDEEGETTVKGVEHADQNGSSLIARGIAQYVPGLFMIDGRPE